MINDGDEVKHMGVRNDTLLKECGVKPLRWSGDHPLVLQQCVGESRKCYHEYHRGARDGCNTRRISAALAQCTQSGHRSYDTGRT